MHQLRDGGHPCPLFARIECKSGRDARAPVMITFEKPQFLAALDYHKALQFL
jgi:hypothetical protein